MSFPPATADASGSAINGLDTARPTLAQAQLFCRRLARRHYENFSVGTWLLPKPLRQHFYNVYAYCRWSDDLGDEINSRTRSLELLDEWREELDRCYRGCARHPVMVALEDTVRTFGIPIEHFADLLVAFRQDQSVQAYESHEQVLEYCRHSANPVGRIILHLAGANDKPRVRLSDSICTGLQLANFCQDVARDWAIGRRYLPASSMHAVGYTQAMFARRERSDAFRQLMQVEVDRAADYLHAGQSLTAVVPSWLRRDVALFIGGGLAILSEIRRIDYDVWNCRPTVSKGRKLMLLAGVVLAGWRGKLSRPAAGEAAR